MTKLESIAARAAEMGLPFLLAGGHAVIAHGHQRSTFDIDLIVPRPDQERWKTVALGLGYSPLRQGPTFMQFNPGESTAPPLDLMLVNTQTFEKLMAAAVPLSTGAGQAKIVSLRHLLALKCHAIKHGHAGRIVKDADDVLRLVQNNRVDPNDPDIRELFLKFGTAELYEKVRRLASPS